MTMQLSTAGFSRWGLVADICQNSYFHFVKRFWHVVVSEKPVWNWHIEYLCRQIQKASELVFAGKPKAYDLLINVPPGSTKSLLISVFHTPWAWTWMPSAKTINFSHTERLVLDFARKSRAVILSEEYQKCWSHIKLKGDLNKMGYYGNTKGGWRLAATVGGQSPIGFHAHFLCLPWESKITTDRGLLPIGKIVDEKLPVKVLAFDHKQNQTRWQSILEYQKNPPDNLYKVTFGDGSSLTASKGHPIYIKGKGYIPIQLSAIGDKVINVKMSRMYKSDRTHRGGFYTATEKSEGIAGDPLLQLSSNPTLRKSQTPFEVCEKVVSSVELILQPPNALYNLKVSQDNNYFAEGILVHNCGDDPIDPKKAGSEAELKIANDFMVETIPSRKVDQDISVTMMVMQRLAQNDPAGTWLERVRASEGELKVKHMCLPAELSDLVKPKALKKFYVDGLLDPVRLNRNVLNRVLKTGQYVYSGQYLQNPVPPGGGMFDVSKLIPETPPDAKKFKRIIRAWDNAAGGKDSDYTVGAKIGITHDNQIWVLHIVRGRWNTNAREKQKDFWADRDGKGVEIAQEQEPGSGGKDTAVNTTIRLGTKGFKVITSKPTGDKVLRADPFSVQVNAGNVYLAKGDWNYPYIEEMRYFPVSTYDDQIDASSLAFNELTKPRIRVGALW